MALSPGAEMLHSHSEGRDRDTDTRPAHPQAGTCLEHKTAVSASLDSPKHPKLPPKHLNDNLHLCWILNRTLETSGRAQGSKTVPMSSPAIGQNKQLSPCIWGCPGILGKRTKHVPCPAELSPAQGSPGQPGSGDPGPEEVPGDHVHPQVCSTAPRRAGLQNGPVSATIVSSLCSSSTGGATQTRCTSCSCTRYPPSSFSNSLTRGDKGRDGAGSCGRQIAAFLPPARPTMFPTSQYFAK